jgi:DNA (cytosine-5)-methyltransferase 1
MSIPVIDLFAGPGGLGEGFAASDDDSTSKTFVIKLSIESEKNAHQTLRLRSF